MKIAMKRLIRDEKGAAMVLALILLLIGGLISAALLAHMGTGLIAGEVYEKRTAELYAADAGVEDALWKIQHQVDGVAGLTQCYQDWTYNMTDAEGGVAEVNDKRVDVTITLMTIQDDIPCDYRIESTATGNGSGTQIDAYVIGASASDDYSGILNQIITSQGEIDLKKVTLNYTEGHEPEDYYEGAWPDTPEEIAQFVQWYKLDVKDEPEYGSGTIDLAGVDMEEGPLYRDGELDILNSINDEATLTLTGTLYITGDTEIGNTDHDFTLDLNGHTLFVASDSTGKGNEALQIGGKCTIMGPGIIIAIGDVYFEPNPDVGAGGEPVFVFSIAGTTLIQPGVNLYGAVAGSVEVGIKQGNKPTINYPEGGFEGLNFPGLVETKLVYSIFSWEVSQLLPEDFSE